MRLAAAPSDQLGIDLAAILDSEKSRSSAPHPGTVEEGARLADNATPNRAATQRSYWPAAAAPAIVVALSLLVSVAGYDSWRRMAVETPQPPQALFDPFETTAGQPSAEETANGGLAAAEPAAPAPPAAAKTLASVDTPAAAPSNLEAPAAEITTPLKTANKAAADEPHSHKGTERHAKSKPPRVAKARGAAGAALTPDNPDAEPAIVSDARRVGQTISGVLNVWAGADRQALR